MSKNITKWRDQNQSILFIAVILIVDKFPNWTREHSERFLCPIKLTKVNKTRRLAKEEIQALPSSEFLAGKTWTLR